MISATVKLQLPVSRNREEFFLKTMDFETKVDGLDRALRMRSLPGQTDDF